MQSGLKEPVRAFSVCSGSGPRFMTSQLKKGSRAALREELTVELVQYEQQQAETGEIPANKTGDLQHWELRSPPLRTQFTFLCQSNHKCSQLRALLSTMRKRVGGWVQIGEEIGRAHV